MTPLEELEELFSAADSKSKFRTVISRAYYVSFRRLVGVATVAGFDQDAQDMGPGRRRSVHRRLFDFLQSSPVPVLQKIGRVVIESLHDLRVKADYKFLVPITRPEAQEALLMAQDIDDWITDAGLKSAF